MNEQQQKIVAIRAAIRKEYPHLYSHMMYAKDGTHNTHNLTGISVSRPGGSKKPITDLDNWREDIRRYGLDKP